MARPVDLPRGRRFGAAGNPVSRGAVHARRPKFRYFLAPLRSSQSDVLRWKHDQRNIDATANDTFDRLYLTADVASTWDRSAGLACDYLGSWPFACPSLYNVLTSGRRSESVQLIVWFGGDIIDLVKFVRFLLVGIIGENLIDHGANCFQARVHVAGKY